MSCHRIRWRSSLVAVAGAVFAVLAIVATLAPTLATAQGNVCSVQRNRDSCEAQSPTSPAGSQCYWSGLACHLADACGSDCSNPGCQRCTTFSDLCYPLTIACPLACETYPVEQMCNGWAPPAQRAGAAGCRWDKSANKCLEVASAINGTVSVQAPVAPESTAVPANGDESSSGQTAAGGGTPVGLVFGIIALVAVLGVAGMVLMTRHRKKRRKSAADGTRASAATPSVLLASGDSPRRPPSAGRSSSSFAKPSTAYNGTRQVLSPVSQPRSSASASASAPSTPAASLTAVNAASPASLVTSRTTPTANTGAQAGVTSPITSPPSTPIPRPAAAWPATCMSPMLQRSSPPNLTRDSMYTDLSTTVTEHPMAMDYVVPDKSRMTMISMADTDRELGSEVGTPMDDEFMGARRQSAYFVNSTSPLNASPGASPGGSAVGMRMLPSSASVATSEFSAVTDSGSLGPIALPPAPSSRVNSMAGSSAVGSMVPATPASAVPSRMQIPETPGTPERPYSLADIEYYSQVGTGGSAPPSPPSGGSPSPTNGALRS